MFSFLNHASNATNLAFAAAAALSLALAATTASAATFQTVHQFAPGDGPLSGLTLDAHGQGNLYGTTPGPTDGSGGTIFEYDPIHNAFTTLFTFSGDDGGYPVAELTPDGQHGFFGTTESGGTHAAGTIFHINSAGGFQSLTSFDTGPLGTMPTGRLALGGDGDLYGTTTSGAAGHGAIFERNLTTGDMTLVHTYQAGHNGGLVQDWRGNLYGTSAYHGGSIYKIDTDGNFSFIASSLGGVPGGNLVPMLDGLYGTMTSVAIFQYNPTQNKTPIILTTLDGTPHGEMVHDDVHLYGTAMQPNGEGFVFRFNVTFLGTRPPTILATIDGSNGLFPSGMTGPPRVGSPGYGTTHGGTLPGGKQVDGTIFELSGFAVSVPAPASAWLILLGACGILLFPRRRGARTSSR